MSLPESRFRERKTPQPPGGWLPLGTRKEIWVPGSQFAGNVYSTIDLAAVIRTVPTFVERTWDEIHPGPPFASGGPFACCKAFMPENAVMGVGHYESFDNVNDRKVVYEGGWGAPDMGLNDPITVNMYANIGLDQSNQLLFPSLDTLGSQAYDSLRPRLNKADLGVALAEAKDVPRMLKTTAFGFHKIWKDYTRSYARTPVMQPKWAANHFINHQFGWVPFLKDLGDLYNLYDNFQVHVNQMRRDNNSWVRRKRSVPIVESETIVSAGGNRCQPVSDSFMLRLLNGPATAQIIARESTRVWYTGQFRWYRPEFDESDKWSNSLVGDIRRISTLAGIRINPSVVWKATPWSWLVDWVSNAGTAMQRITDRSFDSITSRYMYLMHHRIHEYVLRQTIPTKSRGVLILDFKRSFDIKRRQDANNPWSFRLSAGGFTPRQLAILAALSISRSPLGHSG